MKKLKTIAVAFCLLAAVSTISYAQTTDHSHKASHGGIVQEAGSYHIEMVKDANTISFYLLDAKGNTVSNKGVTGSVDFDFYNKTKSTSTIKTGDKNALQVSNPKANIFEYCTVTLTVNGKTVTSKFKNDASQKDIEHGHTH